jgi:hypothetical protein
VAHKSGTVAPAQLLVRFFSWKQPYVAQPVTDKNRAKNLKTGKKGNFNARLRKFQRTKTETLIAPQHTTS